jgi:hypothetical protein
VLSDDLKELKADVHKIDVDLAKLSAELHVVMGVAKWAGALLVTTILTSGVAGIWWASAINSRVGAVETRLDRIEASITKAIGQAAPKAGQTR